MSASEVEGTRNRLSSVQVIRMIARHFAVGRHNLLWLAWGMFFIRDVQAGTISLPQPITVLLAIVGVLGDSYYSLRWAISH